MLYEYGVKRTCLIFVHVNTGDWPHESDSDPKLKMESSAILGGYCVRLFVCTFSIEEKRNSQLFRIVFHGLYACS